MYHFSAAIQLNLKWNHLSKEPPNLYSLIMHFIELTNKFSWAQRLQCQVRNSLFPFRGPPQSNFSTAHSTQWHCPEASSSWPHYCWWSSSHSTKELLIPHLPSWTKAVIDFYLYFSYLYTPANIYSTPMNTAEVGDSLLANKPRYWTSPLLISFQQSDFSLLLRSSSLTALLWSSFCH